jgi:hypothetical protein
LSSSASYTAQKRLPWGSMVIACGTRIGGCWLTDRLTDLQASFRILHSCIAYTSFVRGLWGGEGVEGTEFRLGFRGWDTKRQGFRGRTKWSGRPFGGQRLSLQSNENCPRTKWKLREVASRMRCKRVDGTVLLFRRLSCGSYLEPCSAFFVPDPKFPEHGLVHPA